MTKYNVLAKVVTESLEQIEIEAESEAQANLEAKKLINEGCYIYLPLGAKEKIEIMEVTKS